MALQLKPGVSVKGVQPETLLAMQVADGVYTDLGILETVVTSVVDGTHGDKSLHPAGYAFDQRLPSRSSAVISFDERAAHLMHQRLGPQYDVVLEGDHIHTEFDPK